MRPPGPVSGPPVPIQEAVGEFIGATVGRAAIAEKVTPTKVTADSGHVIATYRDTHGAIGALAIADLDFAARVGAALGMVPAPAAREAVTAGSLPDTLFENFEEVANIMSVLLNSPSSPHLRRAEVRLASDAAMAADVWQLLAAPGKRREFAVTIDGYGDGRLGIAVR